MSGVLVTGAGGFIGLPMVTELVRCGLEVHALTSRARAPQIGGVRWHRVDLLREESLAATVAQIEPRELVHLAWHTKPEDVWRSVENLLWVGRSLNLVRAFAHAGGRRLLMIGSCAEYDWSSAAEPLSEVRSNLLPASLYGASKDALRRVVGVYAEQEGIELAWGRPFFLYGPREASARLVPSVVRSLLAGEPVATSSGKQVRDYMYVQDVALAVVALLRSGVVGEVNIASGIGVSVGEILDKLAHLIGSPELIRRGGLADRPGEPPMLVADVARLRDEVGFHSRWSLDEGLAATVGWWERQAVRHADRGA
jgi:nucleoside-diphosphate-sugar epimerase